jgi:hypothetical protein
MRFMRNGLSKCELNWNNNIDGVLETQCGSLNDAVSTSDYLTPNDYWKINLKNVEERECGLI